MIRVVPVLLAILFAPVCIAQEAPPAADDPMLESRVRALSAELRCLVCQNESLAESNADLAVDLRNQVREMIQAGKSDAQIREFMVARYGDFVLFKPPMKASTLVLWFGPFALLIIGGALLALYLRRRERNLPASVISDEERERARALLAGSSREDQ